MNWNVDSFISADCFEAPLSGSRYCLQPCLFLHPKKSFRTKHVAFVHWPRWKKHKSALNDGKTTNDVHKVQEPRRKGVNNSEFLWKCIILLITEFFFVTKPAQKVRNKSVHKRAVEGKSIALCSHQAACSIISWWKGVLALFVIMNRLRRRNNLAPKMPNDLSKISGVQMPLWFEKFANCNFDIACQAHRAKCHVF